MRDFPQSPQSCSKYRDDQIDHISTWAQVPDEQVTNAATHVIRVRPAQKTTVTTVNPLDPGNPNDTSWYESPVGFDSLIPAGDK